MADVDFSGYSSRNPLAGGARAKSPRPVEKLEVVTVQVDGQVERRLRWVARQCEERRQEQADIKQVASDIIDEFAPKTFSDEHTNAIIESSRIFRHRQEEGDALYDLVLAILAEPPQTTPLQATK